MAKSLQHSDLHYLLSHLQRTDGTIQVISKTIPLGLVLNVEAFTDIHMIFPVKKIHMEQ